MPRRLRPNPVHFSRKDHYAHALPERRYGPRPKYQPGGKSAGTHDAYPTRLAWPHYQPGSTLAMWFRERIGTLQGRTRRIAIVGMARKLHRRRHTGSPTVFVLGGLIPPRFRWVASHRGSTSCMRHSGAGPHAPTVCKVTQPCCDCRTAPDSGTTLPLPTQARRTACRNIVDSATLM
jgi:hypothetical protein